MQEQPVANVRWGEWIGEGWQMFANKWQVWVSQLLIVFGVFLIPMVPFALMMFSIQAQAVGAPNQPPELPALFFPMVFGVVIFSFLAGPFFLGGLYKTAFKQLRGEPISVGDVFSGGDVFPQLLGTIIAAAFFAMLGALFCILPAYVVSGLLFFAAPLIVERRVGVGEALSMSFNATKGNWFMFTLFAIVVQILAGLGSIACYVGILATMPLQFTITTIAYRDIFGVAGARNFLNNQPQYPTNYAPQSFPMSAPELPSSRYDAPAQPEATASICPNCGTQIVRSARFCSKCGNPIGA